MEIAAKLPAAAITAVAWAGASRLARRTANPASPAPSAISGASGPSTAPKPRVASAASATPGISIGVGAAAPAWNPSAGECPPRPGRYLIVDPTSRPHTTSSGSGHHHGGPSKPSCPGRSVYSHSCRTATSLRKPYAAAEMGMPRSAASTRMAT